MPSFICFHLPSKERNNQDIKSEEKTSLSTISALVIGPNISLKINQSYSDIDYFPMKSGVVNRS
jgi:hypothetical protein